MAYTAAVSIETRSALRLQHSRVAILYGQINITSYHATLAEITGITNLFRATPIVVLGGPSDEGFVGLWVPASKAVKCFYPSVARTHDHDLLIKGGQAAATTNVLAHYATDILGKEAATDATIAGADSAAKGGVLSEALAAAAGSELANDVDAGEFQFFAIGVGR